MHRHHQCRRAEARAGGDALPFALPGARATFTPDRDVDVRHLRIEVALDCAAGAVDGVCTLTLVPLSDGRARVTLDAVEMQLHAVTLADGAALDYSYDGARLAFDLGERKEGEAVDVVVRYRCTPRRGLYFIRPDDAYPKRPVQAWSQGQDEDNRCWFPCFDHPTMKSTSEVVATVPKQMTVLSNGQLVGDEVRGDKRTVHYRQEVPHSSYLVTLVAGEYVELRDRAGAVELRYFVNPGREEDAPRTF